MVSLIDPMVKSSNPTWGQVVDPNQNDPVVDCTHQDNKTMPQFHYQLVEKSWISLNKIYIDILTEGPGQVK